MNFVINKWLTLVGNEEWNPLSTEAEQIVVLTLVLDKIKDKNLRLYKAIVKYGGW